VKACIINFSARKNGNCHDIAKIIEQSLVNKYDVTLYEMCDLNVSPCGKCRYECFITDNTCPYSEDDIKNIYSSINSSNFAYFVVPNYSDYPNAYFYIFNERSQSVFTHQPPELYEQYLRVSKKFVVVSNTEEENFAQAFKYHLPENCEAEILFIASKLFDKSSVSSGLMESEQARQLVIDFI
jgi:multimeric flavodoxin WrbA